MIGNLCVYFEAQEMAGSSAKTNCAGKFGNDLGRLFEPKSLAMHQSVYDLTQSLGLTAKGSYIGVDFNSEGKYVYFSNGEEIPFTIPWNSNEPNGSGHGSEVCMVIGYQNAYEWNDAACSHIAGSICERV